MGKSMEILEKLQEDFTEKINQVQGDVETIVKEIGAIKDALFKGSVLTKKKKRTSAAEAVADVEEEVKTTRVIEKDDLGFRVNSVNHIIYASLVEAKEEDEDGLTKDELLEKLVDAFPDRDVEKLKTGFAVSLSKLKERVDITRDKETKKYIIGD
jgi:transcription elongation factor